MRNLKRALSLALASIMVLGMMVVGAGAVSLSDFSDGEKIVNQEAVTVLTTLGVINGKDDGTYDPEGIVTRAEMAKMICIILNGGRDPQLGETLNNSYTDTVGHWAAGYIEYCTTMGIVAGRGNGTFDPSGTVSVAEAGKMVLVALGYNSEVEGYTGANWQINVDARANPMGLYDGLGTLNTNVDLTRDNAAQMLYNALDKHMVTYNYAITGTNENAVSIKPQLNDKDKGTLLYEKFNAVKVEGVVVANEAADLTSTRTNSDYAKGVVGSALDAGKTELVITNDDDQTAYAGTKTFNISSSLAELGRGVSIYVKVESNSTKAQVIGSVIVSDDNKVVADYSGDSIKDVADDNNLDVTSDTKIAYNYASLQSLKDTGIGDAGYEKLIIDTDNDGKIDYVLYNTVQLGKVTKYSTSSDGSITVSLKNGSYTVDDQDDVVGFDDVAKDDMVLASFIGGKLNVEKAETIIGNMDAYKNNSDGETTKLTVDGTDYNVSFVPTYVASDFFAAVDQGKKENLDTEATFYLDAQGYIIASGEVTENAYNYAYVMVKGNNNLDDRVKVALSDGSTGTYTVSSKSSVKFNNVDEGKLYAYTITSDKEIKLTAARGYGSAASAKFEKGKSTIALTTPGANTDAKEYANNSTVFFYVDGTDVKVYTGRSKAPSIDSCTGVKLAFNNAGTVVAAVFDGVTGTPSVGDHLFIYSMGKTYNDYREANVVLNGKDTTETIKVDNGSSPVADTLYTYSVNSDGYYELDEVDGEDFHTAGNVDHVYSNSLIIDGEEFLVNDKTVVIDNDGNPGTPDVIFNGNVNKNAKVEALVDDDTIVMLVIVKDANSTNGGVDHDEYDPTVAFDYTNGNLDVRFYHEDGRPSNSEVANLVKDQVDDVESVSVRGTRIIINYTDGFSDELTINPVPLARITYNGKDSFWAAGEEMPVNKDATVLSVETDANGDVTYTKETTAGNKYTVADGEANVVLVDGYKVDVDTNSLSALIVGFKTSDGENAVTPATVDTANKLVAAKDIVVIKANTDKTTIVTDSDSKEVFTTVVTEATGAEFTMPAKGVVLSEETTPTKVTITLDDAIVDGVYTANNTADKFKVTLSANNGETGDVITVTVTADKTVSEDVTLTLGGTTFTPATLTFSEGSLKGTAKAADFTLEDDATIEVSITDSTTAP